MLKQYPNQNYYHGKINLEIIDKASEFIEKTKDTYTDKTWNCNIRTSYNTTSNILNLKELHELKLNIISKVDDFMYARNDYYDGCINGSWINIYEKNFYQEFHTHEDDLQRYFTGVIYFTKNNSNIELNISNRVTITPEYGDILIFDDFIPHRVFHNLNDEMRISLAFNYKKVEKWKGLKL